MHPDEVKPSVMRSTYRQLTPDEMVVVSRIKALAEELHSVLNNQRQTREIALAKTKLEESVMWAVKSITA